MATIKYYFKKPRGEIVKDLLVGLLVGGAIALAATSPLTATNILNIIPGPKRHKTRSALNAFYRLKKEGCLNIEKKNHRVYISLTQEGKRRAGMFQMNDLSIEKTKKWDGKWRIVIFDIAELGRIRRDGFRGFLKNLGFYPLQHSVWVQPYECRDEIELLKGFFGLSAKEVQLLVVERLDSDALLRKHFGL